MAKLLFIVVGAALILASVGIGFATKRFAERAAVAEGTVVRLNAGGSHPQIEFTTATGERASYPQGGFIFGYRVGEKVRVLYRPDEPLGTARIDAFGSLWFVPLLVGLLGAALVLSGLFIRSAAGAAGSPS